MPVCGLVVTVDAGQRDPSPRLADLAGVTLGPREGQRLAVVLESADLAEEQQRFDAISRVPGVGLVELAYSDFSDVQHVGPGKRYLARRRREGVR